MDSIEVDPALRARTDEKSEGLSRHTTTLWAQSARKSYSLAPCHHLFVSRFSIPRWVLGDARVALTFLEIAHGMSGAGESSLSCVMMYREGI